MASANLDFFQNLVGGQKSASDSDQRIYAPQDQFARNNFYPALNDLFDNGGRPSNLEQTGIDRALGVADNIGGNLINPTQGALNQLFAAPDTSGQLVQDAITGATAPLFEQFQNMIAPEIRRSSGDAGQPGGSRGTVATRLAANDLFDKAGSIGQQIALQANQQGLNALQGGVGLAGDVAKLNFLPSDVQRQLGSDESNRQANFLDQIRDLMGSPITLSRSETEGQQTRGFTQGFKDIFGGGGGGSAAGGAAAAFSDRRLKRNIKKLGTLASGLNFYSFDYIWGLKAIGVMADEVRKLIPEAVTVHASGFDMVDYSKI